LKNAELPAWPAGSPPAAAFTEEVARLGVLRSYGIESLDDDPELAAIVRFAARLCETEVALVSLVGDDSQKFVAREGIDVRGTPRSTSFCAHAMMLGDVMEVRDATLDPRFADNALVTGPQNIRFYAGQPLVSAEGAPLGALCVVDRTARPGGLTALQREGLEVLAQAVMVRLRAQRLRLAAGRELRQSEEQFRTLADSIPAIAWSATPDGRFEYFNKRMVDFTGLPDDQTGSAFHPEDWKKASAAWQHSLRTGETYEFEHRLCRHDGAYRWMISRAVPVRDSNGTIVRWFGTAVDIHDLYAASESRDLLAKELSHRIKNIFAVIAGLISLSARKYPEYKAFADELTGTIRALGRAHDFVRPVDSAARDNLHGLLAELFAPYGAGEGARVRVSGDDPKINSRAATPLALVFHELATNSAKYGALAKQDGRVTLDVADKGETVTLVWREKGGKVPKKLPEDGFGSRLVEMSVTGQLGGSWERRFEDDGLVVELTVSKAIIAA
jgi:PAS domain S-box-containing protein